MSPDQRSDLHSVLVNGGITAPEAPALLAPGWRSLTYSDVLAQVEALAGVLQGEEVGLNDRVAVVLPNGPEMALCFLAVASVATCAPLNPACRAAEFEYYLGDLQAKLLIVAAEGNSPARDVASAHGIPVLELHVSPKTGALRFLGTKAKPIDRGRLSSHDDMALVLHTSGTTARPKMVVLSHANLVGSASNIASWLNLTPDDRCLNVMPLFHIHGLVGATLAALVSGSSLICAPGFLAFFEWLEAFRPTWYTAVPTIHQAILARARDGRGSRRSSLRFIRSSSAPLPPRVMVELEALFGVPVLEAYGMTEASHQIASNPLPPGQRKPGSVGVAVGTQIAVIDDAGNHLDPGCAGEIVIQGETVMHGYLANDEANAASFTNGWFRTGDYGHLDADGYLFIDGRTKEIINRGGEKVSPRETEEVLLVHPAVAEALVFAMDDEWLGEEVAAAVVRRPGQQVDERELREFAAKQLADFKLPRRIVFLDELPKGVTGKPQRIGLAARLGLPEKAGSLENEAFREATKARRPIEWLWARVLELGRAHRRH